MAATNVDIVNLALTYLGEPAIVSLSGSQKAQVLSANYDQARDEALSYHPWTFATRRVSLNEVVDDNETSYAHVYSLPADMLRALELNQTNIDGDHGWDDYIIEGSRLYSDANPAVLRYIRSIDNPAFFPPFFVEAIAANLARKIANALVQSPQVSAQMNQLYYTQLVQAMQMDSRQGSGTPQPIEQWSEVF